MKSRTKPKPKSKSKLKSERMPALPGIQGKVAIVTGSSSGIGKAVVKLLKSLGAVVHGIDLPRTDLSDPAQIKRAVAGIAKKEGRIDILINNAGVTTMGSLLEVTPEEIDRVFAVNLKAPMLLIKEVLPYMLKAGQGAIVNNSSDQAFVGKRFSAIYGASKAALAQLTKSAALDWGPQGIRFNCVAPGSTDTTMLRQVIQELHLKYPKHYPAPAESESFYKSSVPLNRFAAPSEIAWMMVFLASDGASFVNGAVIPVDGGFTAQ